MPTPAKTPGVYIAEISPLPDSIVEVATAVPAFVGHTEKAEFEGRPLRNKPWRIASLSQFHDWFGFGPTPVFELDATGAATMTSVRYRMYLALQFYFQNGGGPCWIVSVGSYEDELSSKALSGAFSELEKEPEPTLLVVPEAVSLASADECANVQNAAILHAARMPNRFAILDVFDGFKEPDECIDPFREKVTGRLDLAAAYYPWLKTTLVSSNELTFENISNLGVLRKVLTEAVPRAREAKVKEAKAMIARIGPGRVALEPSSLHKQLYVSSPKYVRILESMRDQINLFPPSAALAGVYVTVDDARGVWKSPSGVGMKGVVGPAVNITDGAQEDLNISISGKSVNTIRTFLGEGTLVWGAHTLDGNSPIWRYLSVRRTISMLDESIRRATKIYAFEPNVSATWMSIKSRIGNFLNGIWSRGGLVGQTPGEAYGVQVGLEETMVPQDIQDGILRVSVQVALVRPVEFIVIHFQQQMEKS